MKSIFHSPLNEGTGPQSGPPAGTGGLSTPEHPGISTCTKRNIIIGIVVFCAVLVWLIYAKTGAYWPFAQ